jgi:hypothetical protein
MDLKDMPNMPDDNGIKQLPGGSIVATGVGVDIVRICALRGALEVELAGIRFRGGSVTARVKKEFGLKGSKQKVYEQFCRMHSLPTKDERRGITKAVADTKEETDADR